MSAANNELRKIRRFVDAEVAHTGVRDANLCSPFFAAAVSYTLKHLLYIGK